MESTCSSQALRRKEEIALDLLKFVTTTTGIVRPSTPTTGFVASSAPRPEEHVDQLLALYTRCLKVVEGEGEPL